MTFLEKNKDLLYIDFYSDYVDVLKNHYQQGLNYMQVIKATAEALPIQQESVRIDEVDPATNENEKVS